MWIQIHKNMDPDPDSAKLSKSQEFSLREKKEKNNRISTKKPFPATLLENWKMPQVPLHVPVVKIFE